MYQNFSPIAYALINNELRIEKLHKYSKKTKKALLPHNTRYKQSEVLMDTYLILKQLYSAIYRFCEKASIIKNPVSPTLGKYQNVRDYNNL